MKQVFFYNAIATFIDKDGNKTEKNKMIKAKHPTAAMRKAKVSFLKAEMEDVKSPKEFGKECIRACIFIKQSVPETIILHKLDIEDADE